MSSVIPLEFSEQRVKILSSSPRGSRGVEPGGVVLVVKEGGRDGGGGGDCASCFTANSATAILYCREITIVHLTSPLHTNRRSVHFYLKKVCNTALSRGPGVSLTDHV